MEVSRDDIWDLMLRAGARQRNAKALIMPCPAHDDRKPSLGFHRDKGLRCFAGCTETKEGWMRVVELLRQQAGVEPEERESRRMPRKEQLGEPERVYTYCDEEGNVVVYKARFRTPTGKTFRFSRSPNGPWGPMPDGLDTSQVPLYDAHMLARADRETPVYFVEGEKAAEACWEQGLLACTAIGGSSQRDFGRALEVLRGRTVILWPDNDEPGKAYMAHVASLLEDIAAEVHWVYPPVPVKGDAYDYFAFGGTVEDLAKYESQGGSTFEVLADDEWVYRAQTAVGEPVTIVLRHLTLGAHDATVDLEIRLPKQQPFRRRANLLSTNNINQLVTALNQCFGKDHNWQRLLAEAGSRLLDTIHDDMRVLDVAYADLSPAMGDEWLVEEFLPLNVPVMLYGDGGSLKTFLALDLAVSVAMGIPWLGLRTMPGVVLYLDWEEADDRYFRRRLGRLLRGMSLGAAPPSRLFYASMAGRPLPQVESWLRQQVTRLGVSLLIIDSVVPALGTDASKPEAVTDFFRILAPLQCSKVLIGHRAKGEQKEQEQSKTKPYGSVYWENLCRAIYLVRSRDAGEDVVQVRLSRPKANHMRRGWELDAWVVFGPEGVAVRTAPPSPLAMAALQEGAEFVRSSTG